MQLGKPPQEGAQASRHANDRPPRIKEHFGGYFADMSHLLSDILELDGTSLAVL